MLPSAFAPQLGIDFADCDERVCDTAGGSSRQHVWNPGFEIEIQAMKMRVKITAAFNEELPVLLLGRDDFFSRFRVSFDEQSQTFELDPY